MVVTAKKLMFLRVHEGAMSSASCQVAGHGVEEFDIDSANFDQTNTGIVYAITKLGEILVFETQTPQLTNSECKLVSKVKTGFYGEKGISFDIRPIKQSVIVHSSDGRFEYYNLTTSKYDQLSGQLPIRYSPFKV